MSAYIMKTDYPSWICFDCGHKYGAGKNMTTESTWHNGVCGICRKEAAVTEPRDFGHLKNGWEKEHE